MKLEERMSPFVHSLSRRTMPLMRTTFFIASVSLPALARPSAAREPVLIAGGSTPPQPVMGAMLAPAAPVPIPVAGAPVVYVRPVQVVSGGYYSAPNVIYFGGPNSCYYNTYPGGYYRSGCSYYSPSVIYFGRGRACERGDAFRHLR